jgi:hypothetical protein
LDGALRPTPPIEESAVEVIQTVVTSEPVVTSQVVDGEQFRRH